MAIPYAEVIGDPIGHSRSPAIHAFWLARLGLEGHYRATRVTAAGLADYLALRSADPDWRGCNITIPHKQGATGHVDLLLDGGVGAINCITPEQGKLVGRNTDMGGFDAALPVALGSGDRVVMLGAGGAAAAALAAFKARGVDCDIVVRQAEQGRALLDRNEASGRVFTFDAAREAIAGSHGLINASPLGMNGFPAVPGGVLAAVGEIGRGGFVLDMVYAPLRTALIGAAEREGVTAIDGLEMLIGQAALAFRFFFGEEAPRDGDAALRSSLTA